MQLGGTTDVIIQKLNLGQGVLRTNQKVVFYTSVIPPYQRQNLRNGIISTLLLFIWKHKSLSIKSQIRFSTTNFHAL